MKQKDLLILLIPLFSITILWVIFNIYHNYVTSTIKDPLNLQIIPIEGSFNSKAIENIKERKKIEPLYIIPINAEDEAAPNPSPSIQAETESASDSAQNDNLDN